MVQSKRFVYEKLLKLSREKNLQNAPEQLEVGPATRQQSDGDSIDPPVQALYPLGGHVVIRQPLQLKPLSATYPGFGGEKIAVRAALDLYENQGVSFGAD
jgi:hypothetical protein